LTDRIEIPTVSLGISNYGDFEDVSSGYDDNNRQPEMVIWLPKPEIHMSF